MRGGPAGLNRCRPGWPLAAPSLGPLGIVYAIAPWTVRASHARGVLLGAYTGSTPVRPFCTLSPTPTPEFWSSAQKHSLGPFLSWRVRTRPLGEIRPRNPAEDSISGDRAAVPTTLAPTMCARAPESISEKVAEENASARECYTECEVNVADCGLSRPTKPPDERPWADRPGGLKYSHCVLP